MRTVKSIPGQSIYDIAAQEYGTADAAHQLLLDNPHVDYENDLEAGTELAIDDSKVIDKKGKEYFDTADLKPATAVVNDEDDF